MHSKAFEEFRGTSANPAPAAIPASPMRGCRSEYSRHPWWATRPHSPSCAAEEAEPAVCQLASVCRRACSLRPLAPDTIPCRARPQARRSEAWRHRRIASQPIRVICGCVICVICSFRPIRVICGPARSRQSAHLLGCQTPGQEARRHRYGSDHAGRGLRLGKPRHPRRAMEGRRVPLPDA